MEGREEKKKGIKICVAHVYIYGHFQTLYLAFLNFISPYIERNLLSIFFMYVYMHHFHVPFVSFTCIYTISLLQYV